MVAGLTEALIAKISGDQQAAEEALAKAEKLVDAISFYNGRFACVYGSTGYLNNELAYHFIDSNGDFVIDLSYWFKAEPFSYGFSRVENKYGDKYLLDTFGNTYSAAYSINNLEHYSEAIDLSQGAWLNEFPYKILNYTNLRIVRLDFRGKSNFHLPSTIRKLDKLEYLNLTSCGLRELPESIGELKSLTHLILGQNYLNEIPSGIFELKNLVELDLSFNDIVDIPDSIKNLTNLLRLDLSLNPLCKSTEIKNKISTLLPNTRIIFHWD